MSSNRYTSTNILPATIVSGFMEDPIFSLGLVDFATIPSKVSNSICSAVYPKSDIYTTEDGALHIECACSGFEKDEITASYKDNYITINLKKVPPKEKRCYLQAGIKYSKDAEISFYIDPIYYDADKAEADFKSNGLFCIMVPRNGRLAKNRTLFGNDTVNVTESTEVVDNVEATDTVDNKVAEKEEKSE